MKLTKKKLRKVIKEEIRNIREADPDKTPIPTTVKKFMTKFISAVRDSKLTQMKKISILKQVISGLGIDAKDLTRFTQKIKKGL